MDFRSLRIVFMGTPDFAVASLDALVKAGCTIVGVVTAPDRPAGRGMQLQESAVKTYARAHQLPVLQPEKLRDPHFLEKLDALNPDLQVVVAFRMLPELVWNRPPMGTINVHGSLLPNYRGAAPINWAVINGEKETGVTTFKLQHAIDTGNILLQEKMPIGEEEDAGSVHDRMKILGAATLVKTIQALAAGTLQEIPQETLQENKPPLHHAPKIFTETCHINWFQPIDTIYNLIRGLAPYPGAFTLLEGKTLKIFASRKERVNPGSAPGQFETDQQSFLKFAAPDGYIFLEEIQLQGKKKMKIADFLRGYRFTTQSTRQ
ncbi:methionyl-tRNA formyltransferase [Flavihumibacter sp. CACIAM 22H1]|uniref:methionyl-tRNA formyltransferase n=1 Tax=Flavihumibacter sp. CACIAM 22H1 TaxID=1812911 RepID=UPI000A861582|nr:methionyl-tRNA formyltransferase [Flavihumibacter sp. CACIAM 22H1]